MLDRGLQHASPGTMTAAAGEVLATGVLARMMHRVMVDNWEAEKAVEDAQQGGGDLRTVAGGVEETAMPTRRDVLQQAGMVARGDDRTLVVSAPGARGAPREIDRVEFDRPGATGG